MGIAVVVLVALVYFSGILRTEWLGMNLARRAEARHLQLDYWHKVQIAVAMLLTAGAPYMGGLVDFFFLLILGHLTYNCVYTFHPRIDYDQQTRLYLMVLFDLCALINVSIQLLAAMNVW